MLQSIQDFQKFLQREVFQTLETHNMYIVDEIMIHTLVHYPIEKLYYVIENYFFNVLQALGVTTEQSFNKLKDQVIARLALSVEMKKSFRVLSLVRNALHNNGVHIGSDEPPIDVGGIIFNFKSGKHIDYQDFSDIFVLIERIIENLKKLLCIKTKNIEDRFISSIT